MFRRAYRMSFFTFKKLYMQLKQYLRTVMLHPNVKKSAPNGRITLSSRLGIAIRYFAGGDPYDIHVAYGVSYCEIFRSVDFVVDAVNSCPALNISFPSSHTEQKKIASAFERISAAGFPGCCGCIDGMLVWTHQPTAKDTANLAVGCKQFFCGRKHKFGLNLQAVCDSHLRFLDISIIFGGSTSDTLAFELSHLKEKLTTPGFLAPGLHLFGDNAYINSPYLATPFPNVRGSAEHMTKDSYNYFHSNLRIKIECAFGVLVQRWGFLRKKSPQKYTISKTISVVSCLCRLHNFLIDAQLQSQEEQQQQQAQQQTEQQQEAPATMFVPPQATDSDELNPNMEGAAPFEPVPDDSTNNDNFQYTPHLADVGHHADDHDRKAMTRQAQQTARRDNVILPRDQLHEFVANKDLQRPVPREEET